MHTHSSKMIWGRKALMFVPSFLDSECFALVCVCVCAVVYHWFCVCVCACMRMRTLLEMMRKTLNEVL